jgi:hypothetical protein
MRSALALFCGLAVTAPASLPAQIGKGQSAGTAAGQGTVITTMTMDDVEGVLRRMGYSFEPVTDRPRSRRFRQEGRPVVITLNERGNNLIMWSWVPGNGQVTLEKVNEWNKTKRFSRVYLDSDGDPNVEWDIDIEGGSTLGQVQEGIRTFGLVLQEFTGFF